MLERAGLCLVAATRAIGHPIGVHTPEFWPVWKSFVERNERIDEALRGRKGKNAPRPPREPREVDLSGAIEMTPEIKAKLGLTKGRGPDYSATLRSCPALDNGTTVARIISEWGRDESFVEFDDGFGAEPTAPAKVEAPPAATPASAPVDEARREENDDLAHHETLAHAIKDRLDGLETQYGDRRGDESHGRVLQFALEFLGDKRLTEISARDLRHLEQALTEIPGRAKIPGEHGKTLYARYAYGQRVGIDTLTRISSTTVENTYFGTLNAFLTWAKSKTDWTPPAFIFNAKCEKLAEPQQRDAFRNDELMRFFSLPLFTGCASPTHIWRPGTCFAQNGLYWGYILHIFTGLRPSEIGKLRTADIVRDGEFWFIDMRREKTKTKKAKGEKSRELKTDNAYRRVPIPSLIVDLGIVDLKIALEARGETRLFPDWHVYRHPGSGREMWGHYLSKSWQYVRGAHEFERDFLTLYSGRHTLAGWYDAMKLPQRIRDRLFGHAAQGVPGNYGPIDLTLDEARAALGTELKVQFDIANILLTAKLKAEYGELTPAPIV
jgi:integrase